MTEDQNFYAGLAIFGVMILFILFALISKRGAEFEPLNDTSKFKHLKGDNDDEE